MLLKSHFQNKFPEVKKQVQKVEYYLAIKRVECWYELCHGGT